MKKIKTVVWLLVLCFTKTLYSQIPSYLIQEGTQVLHDNATTYSIDLTGFNSEFVEEFWNDYVAFYGGEMKQLDHHKGVNTYIANGVAIPELGNNITVYSELSPNSAMTGMRLTLWFKEDGCYFYKSEATQEQTDNIKKWQREFRNFLKKAKKELLFKPSKQNSLFD